MPRFDSPLNTNDQSLDRVLGAGLPVALVLTNGATLEPALESALRQTAQADAGRLLVARLNTQDNPAAAARFDGALPALITFREGQEVSRAHAITRQSFGQHVDHLLGRGPRPSAPPQTPDPAARQPRAARSNAGKITGPIAVSDATFEREVLNSPRPVLVDLWAPWCGPCHMIAPIVERIAQDYAGRLTVAKLNVDDNPRTAGTLQVQGIPTLLIVKNGRIADRIVGVTPERLLRGKIDAALRA